ARDGGVEVAIPALWADDASGLSGTEPARVWASKDGSAQFTIDLADVQAQGAGVQWTAASAAAAAVGSMASGLNPGSIDVRFGVSGPIDGPSAGGVLTVGVLAALLDAPIRGDMTMTGTISPDGSIGPVGSIRLKLQAAADQGYRTVLLPIANMAVRNPQSGQPESAADVGKALGLQVVPVANVQQAFTLFTDGAFAYPSATPFVLPPVVRALADQQTTALLGQVGDVSAAMGSGPMSERVAALLQVARTAADDGRSATAYGVGMLALNLGNRELASTRAQAQLAAGGTAGATSWLSDWVRRSRSANEGALAVAVSRGPELGYEQQITLPNALTWLTYNQAILASVRQQIDAGSLDDAQVDRFARVLADVDAATQTYFPNQHAIVLAAPTKPSPGQDAVAGYLARYTTFLVRAGQAQQNYVQQVVLAGKDPAQVASQNDVGLLLPVVLNLADAVARIPPSTESISDELRQATTAVTYYIATASLIAAVQDFGIDQFGIGAEPTGSGQAE
ncbi:MAG: S16 family serine protease, partial [Actinomycetales bacterium]